MLLLTLGAVIVEAALLWALLVGYRRGNTPAVVNTAAAALLTLVPPVLAAALGVDAGVAALTLVIGIAGFLHSLGMLGYYESVGWWDHLTHTLSAVLGASVLYTWLAVSGVDGTALAAGTIGGLLVLGVLWEIAELVARDVAQRYDIEPVLVHYGVRDTALDLLFDLVGAAIVVALEARPFRPTVEALLRAIGAV